MFTNGRWLPVPKRSACYSMRSPRLTIVSGPAIAGPKCASIGLCRLEPREVTARCTTSSTLTNPVGMYGFDLGSPADSTGSTSTRSMNPPPAVPGYDTPFRSPHAEPRCFSGQSYFSRCTTRSSRTRSTTQNAHSVHIRHLEPGQSASECCADSSARLQRRSESTMRDRSAQGAWGDSVPHVASTVEGLDVRCQRGVLKGAP
jgi:hypothetical protein